MAKAELIIVELMVDRDIPVARLADMAEISNNSALSYRRNSAGMLSKEILEKIADALGVEVWELFLDRDTRNCLNEIAEKYGIKADNYSQLIGQVLDRVKV